MYCDIGYFVSIFCMVCVETLFLGTHTLSIRFDLKTGCDRVVPEPCQP
jgi:hypothetical protein